MSESAFDDYLTAWREANPQRAVAWLFLRADERACFGALAALEYEWLKSIHEISEPQVGAAKLGWWREEMQRAMEGQARHPLTQPLFADARARRVPLAFWTAPVDAALRLLVSSPPADFAAQCESAAPLARALAELELQVWFDAQVESGRAAQVTLLARLVANLRALEAEIAHARSPLPMNLLARHALSIDGLAIDSPARREALRDYIGDLQRGISEAAKMPGPLGLLRAVELQNDLSALERAAHADDPLQALRGIPHGPGNVLKTWRAARTWRKLARNQTNP